MIVGDFVHVTALQAERKPIPQHLQHVKWSRKTVRPSSYQNKNLGFVLPGTGFNDFSFLSETITKIPFERIDQVVGFGVTVYDYSRVAIIAYRYG